MPQFIIDFIQWINNGLSEFGTFLFLVSNIKNIINWISKKIKWRKISPKAQAVAFIFNNISWGNLQREAPIIPLIGFVERPEVDNIFKLWQETDTPIILHGEAGTGKSGIAIRLGQKLSNLGMPVLFINALDFQVKENKSSGIQDQMIQTIPTIEKINILAKENPCAVIIDQLDSVAGTDLCKYLSILLKSLPSLPNVKILTVSRDYELLHDQDISSLGFKEMKCGQLLPQDVVIYLNKVGIVNPSEEIIKLAGNLLNLSIISDVSKNTSIDINHIADEINLWEQFYKSIEIREGEEIAEFALEVSRQATSKIESTFYKNFPKVNIKHKLVSRNILIEHSDRRFSFRHEQLQYFLCAYSLLPEQPSLIQIVNQFGEKNSKNIITWLHRLYHNNCPDNEATFIDEVLHSNLPFFTRVSVLENLKIQPKPNKNVANIVNKYSENLSYMRFFFNNLYNPVWIPELYETGLFFKPPDPIEKQPRSFQMIDWPEGRYLARFADQYENIAIDIVKNVSNENTIVQEILVDLLLKISPNKAEKLLQVIDDLLDGRFSEMLPIKLISLTDHFLNNQLISAAAQIFEYVMAPSLPYDKYNYSKFQSFIRYRSEKIWVDEYSEKEFSKFIKFHPNEISLVFERLLNRSIEIINQKGIENPDFLVGYLWRQDISNNNSSSEYRSINALDRYIDGLRDSVAEICKISINDGRGKLISFIENDHIIFNRIGMNILSLYGNKYPDLIEKTLLNQNLLLQNEYESEYCELLRGYFPGLPIDVRSIIISRILSGPTDIEIKAQRYAEWMHREITDDDRKRVKEEWIHYRLEIIRDSLSDEALLELNTLTNKYGSQDISKITKNRTIKWEIAQSPIPIEELEQKSFIELQRLFSTFGSDGKSRASYEALADTFRDMVSDNFQKYKDFATFLVTKDIRLIFTNHYLSGICDGLKEDSDIITDEILDLCEYVVSQDNSPQINAENNHGTLLEYTQKNVVDLLQKVVRSNNLYLNRDELNRIRSILIKLAYHPDPRSDEFGSKVYDPLIHSINCVRGKAIYGLIDYSLYKIRQQEYLSGEKLKEGYLEPEIQQILQEKLDKTQETSLAVHSVYGACTPQLYFLSHEWFIDSLEKIYPNNGELTKYWQAAWDAYVYKNKVYIDVFKLLESEYQRGIKSLKQPHRKDNSPDFSAYQNIALHIIPSYISGLTEFDHENKLLDMFFEFASDEIRAQGISWLSKMLKIHQPTVNDNLWIKCWKLWQIRLNVAENQAICNNSKEISSYFGWLENCPIDLGILTPSLSKSIKYLGNGYVHFELLEYCAKYCFQFPLEAITLLQMSIISDKESWLSTQHEKEEQILQAAINSNNDKCIRIATEIINYHGEQGDFSWKYLLY